MVLCVLWKMLNVCCDGKFLLILQGKRDIIIKVIQWATTKSLNQEEKSNG